MKPAAMLPSGRKPLIAVTVIWLLALIASGQGAHDFLGTQGDEWDTQWDMFLALVGAVLSPLTLGGLHDRQLRNMPLRA